MPATAPAPSAAASTRSASGRRRRGRRLRSTCVSTEYRIGDRVYCGDLPPTLGEMRLRDLPSVDELARDARLAEAPAALAVEAARAALARARDEIQAGHDPGDLGERAARELAAATRPRLRRGGGGHRGPPPPHPRPPAPPRGG